MINNAAGDPGLDPVREGKNRTRPNRMHFFVLDTLNCQKKVKMFEKFILFGCAILIFRPNPDQSIFKYKSRSEQNRNYNHIFDLKLAHFRYESTLANTCSMQYKCTFKIIFVSRRRRLRSTRPCSTNLAMTKS